MKNSSIQSLRGICAIVVFLSHSLCMFKSTFVTYLMESPMHLFFDGKCAVYIFFAISGIYYYKKERLQRKTYLNGILKKCIKIYPSYIITLLLAVLLINYTSCTNYNPALFTEWSDSFWNQKINIEELIRQCSILLPRNPDLILPPSWYLTVEVRMFLLMPIVVFIFNYTSWWSLILLVLLSLVVDVSIILTLGFFSIAAFFMKLMSDIHKIEMVFSLYKFPLLLIGLILLNIENVLDIQNSVTAYLMMLGAITIVGVCYANKNLISSNLLVKLGNISYEFYLIHFIVLLSLKPYFTNPYSYILICFIVSLGLSGGLKYVCNGILKCVTFKNNLYV